MQIIMGAFMSMSVYLAREVTIITTHRGVRVCVRSSYEAMLFVGPDGQ